MISSNRSVFSFDSFSCFSSSVWVGLEGTEDALGAGLGDELMTMADVAVVISMECFLTCAYSTGGDAIPESIISMDRLRLSGRSSTISIDRLRLSGISVTLVDGSTVLQYDVLMGLLGRGRFVGTGGNCLVGLAGTFILEE